jgi:hypothetical protein
MNRTGGSAPDPRRLQALARANHIRAARAELKRRVGSGEMAAGEVILRCSRDTETMTVVALLVSQPGWGPRRSSIMLRSVCLTETKTLGSLTERQRVMLASVLGREADHSRGRALLCSPPAARLSGGASVRTTITRDP